MKRHSIALAILLLAAPAWSAGEFYVYADKGDKRNHYIPSGWMGDFSDMKINDGDTVDPADGKTAIKITYDAKRAQGAGWVGIYWQHPANNWGERPGGYDLKDYKRLTFWARGADGGELLSTIKVGGLTGTFMDSDAQEIGPITLTKEWKKYTMDLAGKDLSKIIGGFCWSASGDDNPNGFTIFFDEIRYEK